MRNEKWGSVANSFSTVPRSPQTHIAFAMLALKKPLQVIDIHPSSTSVRSKVIQHNRVVRTLRLESHVCPACKADGQWGSKGFRSRSLRFWEACEKTGQLLVYILPITLARFRCKACGVSHTQYPDFRTRAARDRYSQPLSGAERDPRMSGNCELRRGLLETRGKRHRRGCGAFRETHSGRPGHSSRGSRVAHQPEDR